MALQWSCAVVEMCSLRLSSNREPAKRQKEIWVTIQTVWIQFTQLVRTGETNVTSHLFHVFETPSRPLNSGCTQLECQQESWRPRCLHPGGEKYMLSQQHRWLAGITNWNNKKGWFWFLVTEGVKVFSRIFFSWKEVSCSHQVWMSLIKNTVKTPILLSIITI